MDTFLLPELPGGQAIIRRWLAEPGEHVTSGAPLVIVVTDAVEAVLPAPEDGVLAAIALGVGETAQPGAILAQFEVAVVRRIRATPLARAIAAAHAIDLATLSGSGPAGRINAADLPVDRRPAPVHTPPAEEPIAAPVPTFAPIAVIAGALPTAASVGGPLPLASLMIEADLSDVLALISEQQTSFARRRLDLGMAACMALAVATALPQHPYVNAHWSDDGIVLRRRRHLAVGLPGADGKQAWRLIRDAGDLNLRGVARALSGTGTANPPPEATFSIIDGSALAHAYAAYPPAGDHAAALTVSAAQQRAIALADTLAIRPVARLSLCYDVRVCEHSQAMAFLDAVQTAFTRMAMV